MKKATILLVLFFAIALYKNSFADTLYLKNGSQYTGRTIKQDSEKVVFKVFGEEDGFEVTFYSDDILRIDKAEVPNFITVPFGEGKQLQVPRPIFSKEPMIAEQQAKSQLKQQIKANETDDADVPMGDASQIDKIQSLGKQSDNLPGIPQNDLLLKEKDIIDELTPLLNKEESDYFSRIDSLVQGPMDKMTQIINNPQALTEGGDKLLGFINAMPKDIEGVIQQILNLQAPAIFADFHTTYLNSLNLMRDVFLDMSKGDALGSQTKMQNLQNMSGELQNELSRILEKKKNKSPQV
jgi:hypothetical protein